VTILSWPSGPAGMEKVLRMKDAVSGWAAVDGDFGQIIWQYGVTRRRRFDYGKGLSPDAAVLLKLKTRLDLMEEGLDAGRGRAEEYN